MYSVVNKIRGEYSAKIQPQKRVVKYSGIFFLHLSFPKADFPNIKASGGIREGERFSVSAGGGKLLSTQYSVTLSVCPNRKETCKEISISIYIIYIIYIDITSLWLLFMRPLFY